MQNSKQTQVHRLPSVENSASAIKIQYRDENYGQVYGAVAFRFGSSAHLEDHQIESLYAAVQSAGFNFNPNRAAWIREFVYDKAPAAKQELEAAVQLAGFSIA